jgi:virginiamycin B lyase
MGTNRIAEFSPGGQLIHEFPGGSAGSPRYIVAAPDGDLWFTEWNTAGKVGRIDASGQVTEYSGASGMQPFDIVVGTDGNLWFTGYLTGNIGRIS